MIIFGIESSCDETAAAIVENGTHLICGMVSSSKDFHEKTGGVVPEVAARKQLEFIIPVIESTLEKFSRPLTDIDVVAVTVGPGLIGSLLVGVEAAKALSFLWKKPLIPVNHLIGHIYANFVDNPHEIEFPAVVLLVSGGHTDLVLMRGHQDFEYLGGTLDDAAGEAFDKTARLLGLARYLGGVKLSEKAALCKNNSISGLLPRPMINEQNFDFSFSGLKTAVKRLVEKNNYPIEDVSCEFEQAVSDVLVKKTIRAAKKHNVKSILLGGGVSANSLLRTRIKNEGEALGMYVGIPPLSLCTDNAVYISSAAFFNNKPVPFEKINPNPSLGIMDWIL